MLQCVQAMVMRYTKTYPCLQSLKMCGNTLNMIEIEVSEGYGNFPNMAK